MIEHAKVMIDFFSNTDNFIKKNCPYHIKKSYPSIQNCLDCRNFVGSPSCPCNSFGPKKAIDLTWAKIKELGLKTVAEWEDDDDLTDGKNLKRNNEENVE